MAAPDAVDLAERVATLRQIAEEAAALIPDEARRSDAEQPDTPTQEEAVITHQTLMTRAARHLVAQTGWHTDCTELMADGGTVTVLAHRSGARIEARTTRDGDLAEVCLVGLDAVTIADLAHAIARDGVPA